MTNGYQALINHFTTNNWTFDRDDQNEVIRAGYAGQTVQFRCAALINDDELVQFFAVLPTKVPADKTSVAAEFCVRASFGMKVGSFEYDMESGDIRFHASAPYPNGSLDDAVIRHLVGVSILMTDRYYPAFMSALFGGASPKDAILALEQPQEAT